MFVPAELLLKKFQVAVTPLATDVSTYSFVATDLLLLIVPLYSTLVLSIDRMMLLFVSLSRKSQVEVFT